jgi:crossover junction endodeoxyribonuclease RuvC
MRICGIDPGLRITGWGIVRFDGNRLIWVADGMIRPDPDVAMSERLHQIRTGLAEVIKTHDPDRAAIEEIFVAKNAASALKLGMARGAAMVTLAEAGLAVDEISARRVKQNITGSGRADKTQVSAMISRLLNITPSGVDAADALAVAISASNETDGSSRDDLAPSQDGLSQAISAALARQGGQR